MKIYTKTGDSGETSLFGKTRVLKNNVQIEAYGTVDELNCFISILIEETNKQSIIQDLQYIQHKLFNIGSLLASDGSYEDKLPSIRQEDISYLEEKIDIYNLELPPLKNFILPGGSKANAYAHICRAICRRAERRIIDFIEIKSIGGEIIVYINRLSDYFFVLSRFLLHLENKKEMLWQSK